MYKNLKSFISKLKETNQIIEIKESVNPYLEVAEIHRRVIDQQGPALLFSNVEGSSFPLVTNLFGTKQRVDLAFGNRPKELIEKVANLAPQLLPPKFSTLWENKSLLMSGLKIGSKTKSTAPILENKKQPELSKLPIITSWKTDGGPFVTLPLVYTEHPNMKVHNLGMYRIQIYDDKTTGIHWQIHKGGGFHYAEAENLNQPLPLNLYIGGPPALILSAIAPLPENVPELILASLLLNNKLLKAKDPAGGYDLIGEADFAFCGEVKPFERRPEGPFGDHYGYNSLQHDYPVFHINRMYHRNNPIYPATVVGKPKQEDYFIGDYLQELLKPLFPLVMPAVEDLWSYGDTGFHSLASAKVKVRYPKEAFASGLRILGEGQLSLTKMLFLLDSCNVNLKNIKEVFVYLLERCDFKTDIHIFSCISQDTLDYTGPKVNEGSKLLITGTGEPIRKLPDSFTNQVSSNISKVEVFCPGVLVMECESYESNKQLSKEINGINDWPFIFLVDKNSNIGTNDGKFLWTTFTRCEPANDISSNDLEWIRYHPVMAPPIIFDCRKKPWHTEELFVDEETKDLVDKKWSHLFN
ncbi:MAG: 4-hydroxybenzoate decarboxylase [Planctomycetota bacterium]|nr:MAG: 4-hydroxybenzoate decarboxylase [Planctomycetota bacterium]